MKSRDAPETDLRSVAPPRDTTQSRIRFIVLTRDAPETDLRSVVPSHDAPQAHIHSIFHPVLWNERLNYDNMNARKLIKGGYYEIHYI